MKGTPVTSNTVQSKVSPEAPHTTGGGTIDKDACCAQIEAKWVELDGAAQ